MADGVLVPRLAPSSIRHPSSAILRQFMAASYSLKIITPQGTAYEGMVIHTFLPTENGFVGVLAHHAPYLVSSKGGKLIAREESGSEKTFQVAAGFFEVNHNKAVFLTQNCDPKL